MDGIRFPNERHSVLITSNYGNQKADSRQAQLFRTGRIRNKSSDFFCFRAKKSPPGMKPAGRKTIH